MLSWFTTEKVDHPLADSKESRRVIQELPADAHEAMGEILFWLDSVNSTAAFKLDRRFELLDEVQQAAKTRLHTLARQYMRSREQKFHENRIWTAQAEYWRLTGAGYMRCIEGFQADEAGSSGLKARLPVVVVRALHAIGQQLKWSLLRYSPIDTVAWAHMGRLYTFAETGGFATQAVTLFDGAGARSSARDEALKTLMLAAASAESLPPEQIDLAERSIALFAQHFLIDRTRLPECTHVFDLAMSAPPQRIRPEMPADGASPRYFGAGTACDEMSRALAVSLAEGVLPSGLNLGIDCATQALADVWRHLLRYWSSKPPERSSVRHATSLSLSVTRGFRGLLSVFTNRSDDSLDFTAAMGPEVETWVADNVNSGGYGALAPVRGSEWVRVGALIGLKAEGETRWGAGVVRRLSRESEERWRLGIQLLAPAIVPVQLLPLATTSPSQMGRRPDPGILLTPRPDAERCIQLLIAAGTFSADQALQMSVNDQVFQIAARGLTQTAEECDFARFVLVRRIQ